MIYDEYEAYLKKYKEEFGDQTIVLLECGSFFEIYDDGQGLTNMKEISELLNIIVSRRNKSILEVSRNNFEMAGFPSHSLKKFISILLSNNYTVILVTQTTPPPNPKRAVTEILSPGTNIEVHNMDSSNLMIIYIEENERYKASGVDITIGCSVIDLSTGKSDTYETSSYGKDSSYPFDEIHRLISVYSPREVEVTSNRGVTIAMSKLQEYIDFGKICLHDQLGKLDSRMLKKEFQENIISRVFPDTGILSPIEYINLERKPAALVSYIRLLQFALIHNETIVNRIKQPGILDEHNTLILSHSAAQQLDIITKDTTSKNGSLLNILNNSKTAIGKRYFKKRLLNPYIYSKDIVKLHDALDNITDDDMISKREILGKIYDIERLFRKCVLGVIQPQEFYNLLTSINLINTVGCGIESDMLSFTTKVLNIDRLSMYNYDNIDGDIFVDGYDEEIDSYNKYISSKLVHLNEILSFFNDNTTVSFQGGTSNLSKYLTKENQRPWRDDGEPFSLERYEALQAQLIGIQERRRAISSQKSSDDPVDAGQKTKSTFKLDNTEKEGYYITTTLKRYQEFLGNKENKSKVFHIGDVTYHVKDFTYKTLTNSIKLTHPEFNKINDDIQRYKYKLSKKSESLYRSFIKTFANKYENVIDEYVTYLEYIDFLTTLKYNNKIFRLSRPVVLSTGNSNSYIKAKGLRHLIIEQNQVNMKYVTNDIEIGSDDMKGMLLYGINSAGKSSLMKSIGIVVIMAQAGMYVPCDNLELSPYTKIFTRILSNDDIFRGQSTFTKEIIELRNILQRVDASSLVIGDELCSGTESVSALAIVSAGIVTLSKKLASFVFATHLHDLVNIEEVNELSNVKTFHLSVTFDEKTKALVYDRKLKEGNGTTLYGIEVCKSLDLDREFLDLANKVRRKVMKIQEDVPKQSTYNSKLYINECAICKTRADEVHHIEEQHTADRDGYISSFHKNSLFNLVCLCTKCHDDVHSGKIHINGYVQTSKGRDLQIEKVVSSTYPDKNELVKFIAEVNKDRNLSKKALYDTVCDKYKITKYRIDKILGF